MQLIQEIMISIAITGLSCYFTYIYMIKKIKTEIIEEIKKMLFTEQGLIPISNQHNKTQEKLNKTQEKLDSIDLEIQKNIANKNDLQCLAQKERQEDIWKIVSQFMTSSTNSTERMREASEIFISNYIESNQKINYLMEQNKEFQIKIEKLEKENQELKNQLENNNYNEEDPKMSL